jgi:hypothetical protein
VASKSEEGEIIIKVRRGGDNYLDEPRGCPAEGCEFITSESMSMMAHIDLFHADNTKATWAARTTTGCWLGWKRREVSSWIR